MAAASSWPTFALPAPFFVLLAVALLGAVFLNRTVWGRYLLALGRNAGYDLSGVLGG